MANTSFNDALTEWYHAHGRPFIMRLGPERLREFDGAFERLERLHAETGREVPICFLGASGIGKSTLINALVHATDQILPQGGIGPLTAQATMVRYNSAPMFRAEYHGRDMVNRLRFALEQMVDKKNGEAEIDEMPLNDEDRLDMQMTIPLPGEPRENEKLRAYVAQTKRMLDADQFSETEIPQLSDGLRQILNAKPRFAAQFSLSTNTRIERIRAAMQQGEMSISREQNPEFFFEELRLHASGYLSPLIKTLDVGWEAAILEDGLVLIDLPGVGVANDDYRRVTNEAIRGAKAVVLVVDRAGVTEASADLLRTTGFLNALLHEPNNAEGEHASLMIAVVQLDKVASSDRKLSRQLGKPRSWAECYMEVCNKSIGLVRGQIRNELDKIVEAGADDTRRYRQEVVDRVLSRLEVFPVCATEYQNFNNGDPSLIEGQEDSGIPKFAEALKEVAFRRALQASEWIDRASNEIRSDLCNYLDGQLAKLASGTRDEQERQRLKAELDQFLGPLRKSLDQYRTRYNEFLREHMRRQVETQVELVCAKAQIHLGVYLKTQARGLNWATLRAAVRREGKFQGATRTVNLPGDLTLQLEEPLAIAWRDEIVARISERSRKMGKEFQSVVGEMESWIIQPDRNIDPRIVEALRADWGSSVRRYDRIGTNAVDRAREQVKQKLNLEMEKAVRMACQNFVQSGLAVGTGVKSRIENFFNGDDLLKPVIEAARPVVGQFLLEQYDTIYLEITSSLNEMSDPFDHAADTIFESAEDKLKKDRVQLESEIAGLKLNMPGSRGGR